MQIKSYNRAVDPNTINGQVRAPADINAYGGNVSGCSLCYSCSNVCPARIDLGEQIYAWRQEMDADGVADPQKKMMVKTMNVLMRHKELFYTAIKGAALAPRFVYNNRFNPWCAGREMPRFARRSFNELWKSGMIDQPKKEEK